MLFFVLSFSSISSANDSCPPVTPAIYGTASWYSQSDAGILPTTANRERFDDQQLTCAIWDMPFNTLLKVTNLENKKSVVVRVNDRGPAKRLVAQGRIIDLTKEAFAQIAELEKGLIRIKFEVYSPAHSLP
jgi:rare lipoprotein A